MEIKDNELLYVNFDISNANVFSKISLNNIYFNYKEKNYLLRLMKFNEDEEKRL